MTNESSRVPMGHPAVADANSTVRTLMKLFASMTALRDVGKVISDVRSIWSVR